MAYVSAKQNATSSIPSSECIVWLTVFGMEAVAIVTLNALTIIVYLKERSLCKSSMYLVIHLAVADMFVGASVIFHMLALGNWHCHFWTVYDFGAGSISMEVLWNIFPLASLINLGAISLERAHATFRPFQHRLSKKKIFGTAVAIVWITAGLTSTSFVLIPVLQNLTSKAFRISLIVQVSFLLFCCLIIVVSYSSITIKMVCGSQPHHHGATSRERKLTKTLFIVTIASLLLTLPFSILRIFEMIEFRFPRTYLRLHYSFAFLGYANSFVNPVLYTFRMPDFRRALFSVLHCTSQPQPAPVFPLNEM